ncbi:hypothetical protein HELRODRAFT_189522 [Helobdella robusta]|uniref:UBR-type domain-containing protein n=1 Tax=Helobdella robusta TaxID=6412 RepID=T1FR46_HELRO|nr:hypothetical protein HELRODRAFT_189522 [Helobdella robusta]ESN92600.1 hypothetical protein HELRODRAFT_189522 [Helobdella robusta]
MSTLDEISTDFQHHLTLLTTSTTTTTSLAPTSLASTSASAATTSQQQQQHKLLQRNQYKHSTISSPTPTTKQQKQQQQSTTTTTTTTTTATTTTTTQTAVQDSKDSSSKEKSSATTQQSGVIDKKDPNTSALFSNQPSDIQESLIVLNLSTLQQQLKGNDILLDACASLPVLKKFEGMHKFVTKVSESDSEAGTVVGAGTSVTLGKEFLWPINLTEAMAIASKFQPILADISIVWRLFSIPIFEPLSRQRVLKFVSVATNCLNAAILATAATTMMNMCSTLAASSGTYNRGSSGSKEEDYEGYANSIVQKSLDIFNWVSNIFQKSLKAGDVHLNLKMLGASALLAGIKEIVNQDYSALAKSSLATSATASSRSRKPSGSEAAKVAFTTTTTDAAATATSPLKKSEDKDDGGGSSDESNYDWHKIDYPPITSLTVALANQTTRLLNVLFLDMEKEVVSTPPTVEQPIIVGEFNVYNTYTAYERIVKLTSDVDILELFNRISCYSFFKGVTLFNAMCEKVEATSTTNKKTTTTTTTTTTTSANLTTTFRGSKKDETAVSTATTTATTTATSATANSAAATDAAFELESDTSDSNTYYEEDFSSSQDELSYDDDDSEKILGHIFDMNISSGRDHHHHGQTNGETTGSQTLTGHMASSERKHPRRHSNTESVVLVPDKKEIETYVKLSTDLVNFMIQHYIISSCNFLLKKLTPEYLVYFALIVRELDRLFPSSSSYITLTFNLMSRSLAYFIHLLLTKKIYSHQSQMLILTYLNVGYTKPQQQTTSPSSISPPQQLHQPFWWSNSNTTAAAEDDDADANRDVVEKDEDEKNKKDDSQEDRYRRGDKKASATSLFPYQIRPRTLAVLVEVVLVRQQWAKEKMLSSSPSRANDEVSEAETTVSTNDDDEVNGDASAFQEKFGDGLLVMERLMERLQMVLDEMVKRMTMGSIDDQLDIMMEDVNKECMLMIFFLFLNLNLMEKKVLWIDLCKCLVSFNSKVKVSQIVNPLPVTRILKAIDYLLRNFYEIPSTLNETVSKCIFGVFTGTTTNVVPFTMSSNKLPSYDFYELACSFLLGNPESLDYNEFYDSILNMMTVGTDVVDFPEEHFHMIVQLHKEHLKVTERLLDALPPSVKFLKSIEASSAKYSHGLQVLHIAKWVPRMNIDPYHLWIKDFLVKQGMTIQDAGTLMTNVLKNMLQGDCFERLCAHYFKNEILKGGIDKAMKMSLFRLCNLDMVICYLYSVVNGAFVCLSGSEGYDATSATTTTTAATTTTTSTAAATTTTTASVASPNAIASIMYYYNVDIEKALMTVNAHLDAFNHVFQILKNLVDSTKYCLYEVASARKTQQQQQQQAKSSFDVSGGKDGPEEPFSLPHWMDMGAFEVNSSTNKLLKDMDFEVPIFDMGRYPEFMKVLTEWKEVSSVLTAGFPPYEEWTLIFSGNNSSDVTRLESSLSSLQSAHLQSIPDRPAMTSAVNSSNFMLVSLKRVIMTCLKFLLLNIKHNIGEESERLFCQYAIQLTTDCMFDFLYPNYLKPVIDKVYPSKDDNAKVVSLTLNHILEVVHKPIRKSIRDSYEITKERVDEVLKFLEHIARHTSGMMALEKGIDKSKSNAYRAINNSASSLSDDDLSQWLATIILPPSASSSFMTSSSMSTSSSLASLTQVEDEFYKERQLHFQIFISHLSKERNTTATTDSAAATTASTPTTPPAKHDVDLSPSRHYLIDRLLHPTINITTQLLPPMGDAQGFPELFVAMISMASTGPQEVKDDLFVASLEWINICVMYLHSREVIKKAKNNVPGLHQQVIESMCSVLLYVRDCINVPSAGVIASGRSQERYHCHTCKMVDGVGVCSVCARVCHKGHDLSYAKYGSFFCDCGAREDNTKCLALTRRTLRNELKQQSESEQQQQQSKKQKQQIQTSSLTTKSSATTKLVSDSSASSSNKISRYFPNLGHAFKVMSDVALGGGGGSGGSASAAGAAGALDDDGKIVKRRETEMKMVMERNAVVKHYLDLLKNNIVAESLIDMLEMLSPETVDHYNKSSLFGCLKRCRASMQDLHQCTDTITHGSQEGLFESARSMFSGEQGQTIRQLISSHALKKVTMCVMSSPFGKKQHLAMANEKGKVTLLQLPSLLKSVHTAKKKMTLPKISVELVPFTVLNMAGCPANDDFLAVCGLKECHILNFTSSGSAATHLVLQLALESGNYIIKTLWLPGSQSELAVVTADFVKIYDLSQDTISPQYYFLLPSGKIRDVTFICRPSQGNDNIGGTIGVDGGRDASGDARYIAIMGQAGYIYTQVLDESSSAKSGTFYVTNVLELEHIDLKLKRSIKCQQCKNDNVDNDDDSNIVSYNDDFIDYDDGDIVSSGSNDIVASWTNVQDMVLLRHQNLQPEKQPTAAAAATPATGSRYGSSSVAATTTPATAPATTTPSATTAQPAVTPSPTRLAQKSLASAASTTATFTSESIQVPRGANDKQTTLTLLCEDGSLKLCKVDSKLTDYWMVNPKYQSELAGGSGVAAPGVPHGTKTLKKKSKPASAQQQEVDPKTGLPVFPVDFFEKCQLCNTEDIVFAGNDVLQYYNTSQIRTRLDQQGLYIASIKPSGFSMEVWNDTSATNVLVGIRVMVGFQSIDRAPSHIEVFNRTIPTTNLTRQRWYDIPFTREESISAEKYFTINFGPSRDPGHITMVDSIKVYYKTKEAFGWPDDDEAAAQTSSQTATQAVSQTATSQTVTSADLKVDEGQSGGTGGSNAVGMGGDNGTGMSHFDRLLAGTMEIVNDCFAVSPSLSEDKRVRKMTLDFTTNLLTLATPELVQLHNQALMSTLFSNKASYCWHKDLAHMQQLAKQLDQFFNCSNNNDNNDDENDVDILAERFQKSVSAVGAISQLRPQNVVKFVELQLQQQQQQGDDEDDRDDNDTAGEKEKKKKKKDKDDEKLKLNVEACRAATASDAGASGITENRQQQQGSQFELSTTESQHFVSKLCAVFWHLVSKQIDSPLICPVYVTGQLCR